MVCFMYTSRHQWFVYAQRGSSATQHVVSLFTNTCKPLRAGCTKPDIESWDGSCLQFKFQACCTCIHSQVSESVAIFFSEHLENQSLAEKLLQQLVHAIISCGTKSFSQYSRAFAQLSSGMNLYASSLSSITQLPDQILNFLTHSQLMGTASPFSNISTLLESFQKRSTKTILQGVITGIRSVPYTGPYSRIRMQSKSQRPLIDLA